MTLDQIAQYDGQVVNITMTGEAEAVRGTIELMGRETVRVDAPYHGYRRAILPIEVVLDIVP